MKSKNELIRIVDGFVPGDYIESKELERILGCKAGSDEYGIYMMLISQECENRGHVTRQIDRGFKICLPREANDVNHKRYIRDIERQMRRNRLHKMIDTKDFSQSEKDDYYHRLSIQNKLLEPAKDLISKHTIDREKLKHTRLWPRMIQ